MPSKSIIAREVVAEKLAVSSTVLVRYEARGLLQAVRSGPEVEGYEPEQIRRLWTIVSLQRDLGVNLAGVEMILRLRAHVDEVHRRLQDLAGRLRESLEDEGEPAGDA